MSVVLLLAILALICAGISLVSQPWAGRLLVVAVVLLGIAVILLPGVRT